MRLYPFQMRVTQALRRGQSVVLQAPTGSGKTWAALHHYLETWDRERPDEFPHKCIYSVPLRVLANQFEVEYREIGQRLGVRRPMRTAVQTGARPEDRSLEADLIFTTIDQTLSNFLNIPYALSNRQANLNAGAIVSAYLVFDELHLFDPLAALPTTLQLLHILKDVAPFVLMTATFSAPMLEALASWLNAEVVTVPPDELRAIPSQQGKERRFHTVNGELAPGAVLAHPARRIIAICNTVDRAQSLYQAIRAAAHEDAEVILLHSRFLRGDRDAKEEQIRQQFGKDKSLWQPERLILVATQVVEVGLDITCDVLHTEVAPASSLIQRAGRCARFPEESGDVYVYRVPPRADGKPNYAPYHTGGQIALCDATWEAFAARHGQVVDFAAEQAIIDAVHGEHDTQLLERIRSGRYAVRQQMEDAIHDQGRRLARQLIREIDSRAVIVHPNPRSIENPWVYEPISLHRGSLFGVVESLLERADTLDLGWAMMTPVEMEDPEADPRQPSTYRWIYVEGKEDLRGAPLVAINPALAGYDAGLGFRLAPGTEFESPLAEGGTGSRDRGEFGYQRESYAEHIAGLYRAYRQGLAGEVAHAASRLETAFGLPSGTVDRALRFCFVAHDLGKLSRGWQDWTHRWQAVIGHPVEEAQMLAHTDFDPADPAHQQAKRRVKGKRPPHAVEGARAAAELLPSLWDLRTPAGERLARAVLTAIARHHASGATQYQAFRLHPAAARAIREALRGVTEGEDWELELGPALVSISMPAGDLGDLLIRRGREPETVLYFLLVRVLRLADQRSLDMQSQ